MEITAFILSIVALGVSLFLSLFTFIANRVDTISEHITKVDILIVQDPELFYVYDNEEIEKRKDNPLFYNKMAGFLLLHFNILENVYIKHVRMKMFLKAPKKVWGELIKSIFETELAHKIWEQNKNLYDEDFTKYMDELIEDDSE